MYLESLTGAIEEKALEYIETIEGLGGGSLRQGMLQAIETGYIEREIARASYEYQQSIESTEQVIVGLNRYRPDAEAAGQPEGLFQFDPEEEEWQKKRLAQARATRSGRQVANALKALKQAAQRDENLMPPVLEAVEVAATEGEIMGTLKDVYGEHVDPGVF